MFDIGFWELCLIGVVALVVVGPERLPGLIKSTGYWLGRARQMAANVKSEIQSEVDKAEQLKRLMEEQEEIVKRHTELEARRLMPEIEQSEKNDAPKASPQPVSVKSKIESEQQQQQEQKTNG
ncbi:MAG: Sec-independent protein translocase protein TatB [Gammaproteobacteria bacterium]|nr:Sec-independent protein translocase protein TatB [Gammaproteobacteria bacterium]